MGAGEVGHPSDGAPAHGTAGPVVLHGAAERGVGVEVGHVDDGTTSSELQVKDFQGSGSVVLDEPAGAGTVAGQPVARVHQLADAEGQAPAADAGVELVAEPFEQPDLGVDARAPGGRQLVPVLLSSEERRVGKEWVSTGRSGW